MNEIPRVVCGAKWWYI